jgi:acyl carrier protein
LASPDGHDRACPRHAGLGLGYQRPGQEGSKGELSVETKALDHTELVNQIVDVIVKEGMVDRDKVTPDATIESLDLKSIDIVMILTAIEDKFDVYIPMDGPFHEAKDIKSLIDAIAAYIVKEKG